MRMRIYDYPLTLLEIAGCFPLENVPTALFWKGHNAQPQNRDNSLFYNTKYINKKTAR